MITVKHRVTDVRSWFAELLSSQEFVVDKTGCKMLEVVGATFVADEPAIFGTVNEDYVERELKWYKSMSLNVNDIPGGAPAVWKACATKDGQINSNYGYLLFHEGNHSQYDNVVGELRKNSDSRRAIAVYTRPSIWNDYNKDGMSDFICTNDVQYFIRGGKLVTIVRMRSNDVWAGYRNDHAFQRHVQVRLAAELAVDVGDLIWHAGSLHLYERNFYLIEHFLKTGEMTITKEKYNELYR